MHPPIFGHSFAVLAALILLSRLAFNFLNRKRAGARRNAEDADAGPAGSSASPVETDSGASSSSTAPTGDHYEVFLNFRGPDTRKRFTSHLHHGLVNAGINVFLDDNKLRQGEEIGPDLLEAIKNSKILIPILSVKYCASIWCLDELVQIMECKNNKMGHVVLPIFYEVEPAHVRYQIGSFGDAFHKRKRPFDRTSLEKYKQALTAVSNLKGWEADNYRNEGELVKSIVQKVLSELKKKFELVIPENLVGIDSHVKKVMKHVASNSGATLFIGIYGMGGIGKTTLAKTIFNNLSDQFESRSFISDIRELCNRNGLEYLQNQLISDILEPKIQVYSKDQGIGVLSSNFKEKKVLIILDDVDNDDQLKALAGNRNWFSLGSRILITTRNKSILENARVDRDHEHEELDKNQSLILFCRHAFRKDSPPSEFMDLAHDVVSTTGGLPLSLEVLGSFLCGREPTRWRGTIKRLREVPHKKVQEKLKISYDALECRQKEIFLDIACFLIGADGRIASYMWDACGFFPEEGIEMLRFMSLIKIGDDHKLRMHDQLRDLGREIVREENLEKPEYRSRLWDSKEILKVLKENKGTEKIKAIYFDNFHHSQPFENFKAEQFKKLTGLRFLHVSGACLRGDFRNSMGELKCLRWQHCPSTNSVRRFRLTELVVLDLSWSKISDKWQGWSSMMAEKLKSLDLTGCQSLRNTVFLSAFKNLEVLILCDCGKLKQIDSSIGDLKELKINLCPSIERLDLTKFEGLKILDIDCENLVEIQGLNRLKFLENLRINKSKIEKLDLPKGLKIICYRTEDLFRKSESLDRLGMLKNMMFCGPPSSEKRSRDGCRIQGLDRMMLLDSLHMSLVSIERLDLSKYNGLRTLHLEYCENLVEIQGLNKLKFLREIIIVGCNAIEQLDLSNSKGLEEIKIFSCDAIKRLDLSKSEGLKFLREIDIRFCYAIEQLDLSKSEGLKILYVHECKNLVKIPRPR